MKYYSGKTEEEKKDTFYITNSNVGEDKKLFTIYNPIKIPFMQEEIKEEIKKNNEKEEFNVEIEKIENKNEEGKTTGEICKIKLPDTYSRKSFEPILKKFFCNLK